MSTPIVHKVEIMKSFERLKVLRETIGVNQSQFANTLGVAPSFISGIERNKKDVSRELLQKLLEKYKINVNWLLSGEGEMFLNTTEKTQKIGLKSLPIYQKSEIPEGSFIVPLLDQQLSAGNGSYLPEDDIARALVHVPAYLARFGNKIAALTVDGDSMEPTLSRGDMVVCDSCGWSGEGIYALRMNEKGFVKRLTQKPGIISIISDNPKYESYEKPENDPGFEIIGRVHCAIKEME